MYGNVLHATANVAHFANWMIFVVTGLFRVIVRFVCVVTGAGSISFYYLSLTSLLIRSSKTKCTCGTLAECPEHRMKEQRLAIGKVDLNYPSLCKCWGPYRPVVILTL